MIGCEASLQGLFAPLVAYPKPDQKQKKTTVLGQALCKRLTPALFDLTFVSKTKYCGWILALFLCILVPPSL
jgi:hypothetical protein